MIFSSETADADRKNFFRRRHQRLHRVEIDLIEPRLQPSLDNLRARQMFDATHRSIGGMSANAFLINDVRQQRTPQPSVVGNPPRGARHVCKQRQRRTRTVSRRKTDIVAPRQTFFRNLQMEFQLPDDVGSVVDRRLQTSAALEHKRLDENLIDVRALLGKTFGALVDNQSDVRIRISPPDLPHHRRHRYKIARRRFVQDQNVRRARIFPIGRETIPLRFKDRLQPLYHLGTFEPLRFLDVSNIFF